MIHLEKVVELMDIGYWGYLVLFGLLFSCGLGMPLPEDIPLLVAGMLVGTGKMHLGAAAICAWCGIIGGDCVLYYLGHRYGENITKVRYIGKHLTRARIAQAERLFASWGVWVVAVGRLFAGIRGAMVVAAGTIRFNFLKFLIADGLAALVSGGFFVWLGMKFGQKLDYVEHKIKHYGGLIFWVFVAALVGFIAFQIWRKKGRHRSPSELAVDAAEQVADHVKEHGLHLSPKPAAKIEPASPVTTPANTASSQSDQAST